MYSFTIIPDTRPGYTTTEVDSCGSTWILTTSPRGSSIYCEKPHWGVCCALSFCELKLKPADVHEIVIHLSSQYNRGLNHGDARRLAKIKEALS